MDDYVVEECGDDITNDAGTFRALVVADPEYPVNPREDTDANVGTMVANHRGYVLPQEDAPKLHHNEVLVAMVNRRFRVVARWLRLFHGATVVLPLYSAGGYGLVMAPGSGAEDEDADGGNFIGLIYDTPKQWERLGICPDPTEAQASTMATVTRDDVVATLQAEVRAYNAWANGEVLGWRVDRTQNPGDDEVWETVDTVGGYFDLSHAREEATEALRALSAEALHEHITALHDEALDENEVWDLAAAER